MQQNRLKSGRFQAYRQAKKPAVGFQKKTARITTMEERCYGPSYIFN